MNKLTILIFALAISYAFGACANTVAAHFGLANTVGTTAGNGPASPASCNSFANKATQCCTAADITSFQTKLTARLGELQTAAGERDEAFLDARKAVADRRANYTAYLLALDDADDKITAWTATPESPLVAQDMTDFNANRAIIAATIGDFFTNYVTLNTGYATYQNLRDTCFSTLLKAEAAAYCLSCLDDGDHAAWGVDTTSGVAISVGTALEAALAEDCVPYIESSESQSVVSRANYYASLLPTLITALEKITDDDTDGVTDFNTAFVPVTANAPVATEKPASNCDETACDLITSDMIVDGIVDETATALLYGGESVTTRRLKSRLLQTGSSFNPADLDAEVKYSVSFGTDPGNHGNPNDLSALRVGVFSCIVAFFVALLI